MYGTPGVVALPSTGVGAAAAATAFAGYTVAAVVLAIVCVLFVVGGCTLMRMSR